MHRVLALLLVPALIAAPGAASTLHTHAYGGHDHPEHHHGLSVHEHHVAPSHPDDGAAHLESCEPGSHVVAFAFVSAAPPQLDVADLELAIRATPTLPVQEEHTVRHADVRVHGPPPRTHASPRAPPDRARLIT